jgi:CubicO group peptidase (beta-lactamase class C family)
MNYKSTVLALALIAASAPVEAGGIDERQRLAIDQLVDSVATAARLPSAVVLIDEGGQTIYQRTIGHADLENHVPATLDSVYGMGSITKSVTALAIAQLVEAGRVDLDSPVTRYLPDYKGPGGVATIRQLLTHSSGIPNYTNEIPGIRKGLERTAYDRNQMVAFFADRPLNFAPGTLFSYSNSGYYLLGLVIEATSGTDYYEYLRRNVFEPLGMTHTYSGDFAEVIPRRARGYALTQNGFANAPPWHYLVPFAAGSLFSTAGDIVKYRRGVFRSSSISPAVRATLLQTSTLTGGAMNSYSAGGLILSTFEGRDKISHSGDIWGYASNHAYYPAQDLTIVLMTNRQLDAPALPSVEAKIARIVFGVPQPRVEERKLDDDELTRYAGDFSLSPYLVGGDTFGFIAQQGKLHLRFGGVAAEGPMIPLFAQGGGLFRASFDDEWTFEFQATPGSTRVTRLVCRYRDGTFFATRKD